MSKLLEKRLEGIIAVVPTPLTKEERVDTASARRLTRHLIRNKVRALWILGTGGEMPNLLDRERLRMVEAVVKEADGQIPVIAGVGEPGMRRTMQNARAAQEAGADALQLVLPYYFSYSDKDIFRYYHAVADQAQIPMIIYVGYPPGTGNLSLRSLEKLSRHPMIIGLKYVPGDQRLFQTIIYRTRSPRFSVFTSSGKLALASIAAGADGAVIVEPMIAPRLCLDLYDSAKSGDLGSARVLQKELYELTNLIFAEPAASQSVVKTALHWMGLCQPYVTRPLADISGETKRQLRSLLKRWKVI